MHPRQLSTIKFCYRIKEELHHNHRGDAIERVALLMMRKKMDFFFKKRLNCCCLGHVAQTATFDVAVWVMPN
jgi:hypothetical protein